MCDHIAYCERNELKVEIDRLRVELAELYKKYDDCRETLLEVSNALQASEYGLSTTRAELAAERTYAKTLAASIAGIKSELYFEKRHVLRCKERIAELEATQCSTTE